MEVHLCAVSIPFVRVDKPECAFTSCPMLGRLPARRNDSFGDLASKSVAAESLRQFAAEHLGFLPILVSDTCTFEQRESFGETSLLLKRRDLCQLIHC